MQRLRQRIPQGILIATAVAGSWWGMQAVHELGHVIGAWVSGGRVSRVVLHPLTISRTDLADNPQPLVVVWAGPLLGVFVPAALWRIAAAARCREAFLCRFFAGYCLVANGAYIAYGSFDRIGDAGEMLRHGSPIWTLWLFGVVTVPPGFFLWHGLGPSFGLGPAKGRVEPRAVWISGGACLAVLATALLVDRWFV